MSSSIYWRPVTKDEHRVDKDIWRSLQTYDHGNPPKILNVHHVPILKAFAIAGVSGSKDLLDAIEIFNEIEIMERY